VFGEEGVDEKFPMHAPPISLVGYRAKCSYVCHFFLIMNLVFSVGCVGISNNSVQHSVVSSSVSEPTDSTYGMC
jgi:hypothetical protein